MALSEKEILLEGIRCFDDDKYYIENYLKTYDNTIKRTVPFRLFPHQIRLIDNYIANEENIAKKYRQAGITVVTAAWLSKVIAFARQEAPEKVLIVANKQEIAINMANMVRGFLDQRPEWLELDYDKTKDSAKHFKMTNGCEVKAVATSKDALRGYTPTILVFDEAAYIDAEDDFWAACMASMSTGGKVIIISTPNGYDPIYYEVYDQAVRGINDYKITEMVWYKDPRYIKDLQLINVKDIVDYMLNKSKYEDVEKVDFSGMDGYSDDFKEVDELIEKGYKPYSSWFEKMCKKIKFNKRQIAQELECDFLGSGDNVIDSDVLEKIRKTMIQEPKTKKMSENIWVWKDPEAGHKYVMGIDVSRGDSEDFSTFVIIDFDTMEQVAEFVGKVPPDIMAEIAYTWGKLYNAYIVIDITGGMGVSTSRKLQEMGYKSLHVDGTNMNDKWKYDPKAQEKIPGINFNNKRVQIISSLEEALRYGFKVYSSRLLGELGTFVYINGRPDHQKGKHDDIIMAIAMAIYVSGFSFGNFERVSESTAVITDGWEVNEYEQKEYSQFFNPAVSFGDERNIYRNNPTQADYKQYSWLFGR